MRLVVVGVGVLCVCLVYVVEHMGTVLQLTMSLEAITNGPLFGIFTIGLFLPWINGNVNSYNQNRYGRSIIYHSFFFRALWWAVLWE